MLQDYELDGIDWTKVDFEDNQVCLDLFEKVFIWFKISKFYSYSSFAELETRPLCLFLLCRQYVSLHCRLFSESYYVQVIMLEFTLFCVVFSL